MRASRLCVKTSKYCWNWFEMIKFSILIVKRLPPLIYFGPYLFFLLSYNLSRIIILKVSWWTSTQGHASNKRMVEQKIVCKYTRFELKLKKKVCVTIFPLYIKGLVATSRPSWNVFRESKKGKKQKTYIYMRLIFKTRVMLPLQQQTNQRFHSFDL